MVLVNRLSDEPDGVTSVLSGNSISFKVLLAMRFFLQLAKKNCMKQVASCKEIHIDHAAISFFPVMRIGKKTETLLLLAATCIMRCFFKDQMCCKLWEKSANFYSLASLCIGTSRVKLARNSGAVFGGVNTRTKHGTKIQRCRHQSVPLPIWTRNIFSYKINRLSMLNYSMLPVLCCITRTYFLPTSHSSPNSFNFVLTWYCLIKKIRKTG